MKSLLSICFVILLSACSSMSQRSTEIIDQKKSRKPSSSEYPVMTLPACVNVDERNPLISLGNLTRSLALLQSDTTSQERRSEIMGTLKGATVAANNVDFHLKDFIEVLGIDFVNINESGSHMKACALVRGHWQTCEHIPAGPAGRTRCD